MKPILILAATIAALLFASPAEAGLFSKLFKNREAPAQFTAVEQQPLAQKNVAPKPERFGPLKWLGNRASARKSAMQLNRQKRTESKQQRLEFKAAQVPAK